LSATLQGSTVYEVLVELEVLATVGVVDELDVAQCRLAVAALTPARRLRLRINHTVPSLAICAIVLLGSSLCTDFEQ
jgi:hypothetical protein